MIILLWRFDLSNDNGNYLYSTLILCCVRFGFHIIGSFRYISINCKTLILIHAAIIAITTTTWLSLLTNNNKLNKTRSRQCVNTVSGARQDPIMCAHCTKNRYFRLAGQYSLGTTIEYVTFLVTTDVWQSKNLELSTENLKNMKQMFLLAN